MSDAAARGEWARDLPAVPGADAPIGGAGGDATTREGARVPGTGAS